MLRKKIFAAVLTLAAAMIPATMGAQGVKPLPSLHVEGKWLVDSHGNHVVLHGVMDTPNPYFNSYRWGNACNDNTVNDCVNYFEKLFAGLEKAKCNVFRLHLDPCWTNDPSKQRVGDSGEQNISQYSSDRLVKYLRTLYYPIARKAMNHGLYVVVRPPGVCPGDLKVGDEYQQYLLNVWDNFTKNDSIRRMAGQISIELANEPVNLKNANNQDDKKALHDYFQPIVDKIRANGYTGIIWVPGTGWQSNYTSYATYPIEGYNIGYAVHDYTGWYGCSDETPSPTNKINSFHTSVPVIDTAPIIITEVDWSPKKEGTGHYNEHGDWVESNYGTWSTGSTSKWGKAYKTMLDHFGNISMTLSGTSCLIDVDTLLKKNGKVVPAFGGLEEACGKACMDWYAEYYKVDWPHADFASVPVSDMGNGRYKNPVVFADFPDPDVIRVDNTYYMISTTMHHFPGATILKSQDLVNWEYCAQPLTQLADNDRYNLLNNKNAYAAGMWACSMKYHDGKFYILINGNDAGGFLLTATDPEGKWEMKKLSRIYYDPGMLFDNGKVYVACGIGNIQMCELDENFNYIREQRVISDKDGLEGCHLYKIGDYYYIYPTYGGWPSGQAIFRSTNIFGPYEERMLLEKTINGKPNTIHQGALIETPEGEWWTILQQDLGALGRMPNLQPVTWQKDGWPYIANRGKPYTTWKKPTSTGDVRVKALPTTDNFRSYPLGMQWQWNHNPDNDSWTLFERPGWLRLKASGTATRLTQARNMLTQRIFGNSSKPTNGTIRLDVSRLQEGDQACICIFQDPYAMIAVQVKDGRKQIVWRQDSLRTSNNFTPSEKVIDADIDSVIYLRASIAYNDSKTRFYYSMDNKTYTPLGGQTTLGFNLTVFVGARFGLFCYATKPGGGGSADFDWFTNEDEFDEASIYPPYQAAFSPDMFTVTDLAAGPTIQAMVGGWCSTGLTATYRDGHTENVSTQATYQADVPGIVEFQGGQMRGLTAGSTTVTATYVDLLGNEQTTTFVVNTTFFPFSSQYIDTSIASQGIFNEKTHAFKPGKNGEIGWRYSSGADLSPYKYIVIKLKQKQTCDAHVNIHTSSTLKGDCYSTPTFGDEKQYVIKLREATYTSGTHKGESLDASHVYAVSIWGNGNGIIVIDDMYVTNNDDYSPLDPAAVEPLFATEQSDTPVSVYTLTGTLVRRALPRSQATKHLPAGIYLIGNRKVVVR